MAEYMNPGTVMDTSSLLMAAMAASTVSSMDIAGSLQHFTFTLQTFSLNNFLDDYFLYFVEHLIQDATEGGENILNKRLGGVEKSHSLTCI